MTTLTANVINVRVDLAPEFLSDVLVTAFDGGCGGCWYWAKPRRRSEKPGKENNAWEVGENDMWLSVCVREREASGDTVKWAIVDHAMLSRGMERLFAPGVLKHRGDLRSAVLAQDAGEIDSDGADILVQLAIFGEIVYG